MITGNITENSASNFFNNAKLKKPKLPPIKGMVVTRNSVMGKTSRVGITEDGSTYQAVITSSDVRPIKNKADKRQIVLNVQPNLNVQHPSIKVGGPRSNKMIRATTQATQHRSKKLAPLEVKF